MIRQRSGCQLYASEMLEEASFMELELFREDLYLTGKLLVLQVAPVLFQNVGDLKLSFGCCHVYLAVIRTEFAPRGCLCYRLYQKDNVLGDMVFLSWSAGLVISRPSQFLFKFLLMFVRWPPTEILLTVH